MTLNFWRTLWFILTYVKLTTLYKADVSGVDPTQTYCTFFSSCWDCKKAGSKCDWCHEVGCTHYPSRHCPQKVFLDNAYFKNTKRRQCTEIVSRDPIFVPANINRFLTLSLNIADLTLYKRRIMCEIHVDQSSLRLKGSIGDNAVYCDMTTLSLSANQSVAMGYVRLLWGGAEPYSNMILMIVYKCETMAFDCMECLDLDKRFNCGWCEETSQCLLKEQCPGVFGEWTEKKSACVVDINTIDALIQ